MVPIGGKKWDLEQVISSLESKTIRLDGKNISALVLPICYVQESEEYFSATSFRLTRGRQTISEDVPIAFSVDDNAPLGISAENPSLEEGSYKTGALIFPLSHTMYDGMQDGMKATYLGLKKDVPLLLQNGDLYFFLGDIKGQVSLFYYQEPVKRKAFVRRSPLLPSAKEIVSKLDEYVIGQERAKKKLALSAVRYLHRMEKPSLPMPEANLILIGPSGSGKTLLVSCLEKILDISYFSTKATGKSDVGLVGDSLSSIFDRVAMRCPDESPRCIIHFDEVDKILRRSEKTSQASLQQELIGYTDNASILTEVNLPGTHEKRTITTKNMLFILSGVFDGLEKMIEQRMHGKTIGFGAIQNRQSSSLHDVRPEDLIKYGMEPELVGRFKCVGVLDQLLPEQKVKILTEPKGALVKRYQNAFSLQGYSFSVTSDACMELVKAAPKETGARGVEALMTEVMEDIEFDPQTYAHKNKIVLDADYVCTVLKAAGKSSG